MARQGNYDLGRPEFDLLELKSFRRETILQYSLINRPEQLRIILLSSSAVISACAPSIAAELFPSGADGTSLQTLAIAAYAASELCPSNSSSTHCSVRSATHARVRAPCWSRVSTVGFAALAFGEKSSRGAKLRRLESEYALGELSATKPATALADAKSIRLVELRDKRRVVAITAPRAVIRQFLSSASIYRRRLAQSGIIVVAVPTDADEGDDGSSADDGVARVAAEEGWLWQPTQPAVWTEYFAGLLAAKGGAVPADGAWLALSLKGRSVASGVGLPQWDELLGTKLPPLAPPRRDEPAAATRDDDEAAVLAAQARLYAAIVAADGAAVEALCAARDDDEVSALAATGRLDVWQTVLKYDATVGMVLSGADATVSEGGGEAHSTGIEFPRTSRRGGGGGGGAGGVGSLLCTQRWLNVDGEWRLAQHRTIPYMVETDAGAALRCDRRGCVALQRTGLRGAPGMPGDGMS